MDKVRIILENINCLAIEQEKDKTAELKNQNLRKQRTLHSNIQIPLLFLQIHQMRSEQLELYIIFQNLTKKFVFNKFWLLLSTEALLDGTIVEIQDILLRKLEQEV